MLALGGAYTALLGAGEVGWQNRERTQPPGRGGQAGDVHTQPTGGRCQTHFLSALGRHYTQHALVVQGRVACEINSGDELASTELIFGGVLTQLTPEEAVAVLSALVFQVGIFFFLLLYFFFFFFFSLSGIWR